MNGETDPTPAANPYHFPHSHQEPESGARSYITSGTFRLLLGISLAMFGLHAIVSVMTEQMLPAALRDCNSDSDGWYEQPGTAGYVIIGAAALYLVVLIASYIGMFRLRKWGRVCFAASKAAGIILCAFPPPSVEASISQSLGWLMSIIEGIIIAIAYFTPLFDQAEEERRAHAR